MIFPHAQAGPNYLAPSAKEIRCERAPNNVIDYCENSLTFYLNVNVLRRKSFHPTVCLLSELVDHLLLVFSS